MSDIKFQSKIDVVPLTSDASVRLNQYDSHSILQFQLFQNGIEYAPTATGVALHGAKSSGTYYSYDGSISGSVASFNLSSAPQVTSSYGVTTAELWLTFGDGTILPTENFAIFVEKAPIPDDAVLDNNDNLALLEDLINSKIDGSNYGIVKIDTTPNWNSQTSLVSEKGTIYVYTDYQQDSDGNDIPGFKIGDGKAYVVDLPFVAGNKDFLEEHINNALIHVSPEDREYWNKHLDISVDEPTENAIFYKTERE